MRITPSFLEDTIAARDAVYERSRATPTAMPGTPTAVYRLLTHKRELLRQLGDNRRQYALQCERVLAGVHPNLLVRDGAAFLSNARLLPNPYAAENEDLESKLAAVDHELVQLSAEEQEPDDVEDEDAEGEESVDDILASMDAEASAGEPEESGDATEVTGFRGFSYEDS